MITEKRVTSHNRLGFIGLGYLGSRIARRLVTAGFPMVVHDRDREGCVANRKDGLRLPRM
jgi:3-hydroxyisobutyrate dehydrogenase-like beta-hydroxyacid dehydrogenase